MKVSKIKSLHFDAGPRWVSSF